MLKKNSSEKRLISDKTSHFIHVVDNNVRVGVSAADRYLQDVLY